MSAFHKRDYEVQFWVGAEEGAPPWSSRKWSILGPAFDALVSAGRKPIRLHTSQIEMATKKHTQFGRLMWSANPEAKWLVRPDDARHFENVEMWAPGRAVCEREERSPDTYFDLTNIYGAGGYDWFAVAALALDIPEPTRTTILTTLNAAFSAAFNSVWSARGRRPWGYTWGTGFGDGLQELSDTVAWNLKKADGSFPLHLLRGEWLVQAPAA